MDDGGDVDLLMDGRGCIVGDRGLLVDGHGYSVREGGDWETNGTGENGGEGSGADGDYLGDGRRQGEVADGEGAAASEREVGGVDSNPSLSLARDWGRIRGEGESMLSPLGGNCTVICTKCQGQRGRGKSLTLRLELWSLDVLLPSSVYT